MTKHMALIAGASGVIGSELTRHMSTLPDWQVIAASRRPCCVSNVQHLAVDLLDGEATSRALQAVPGVTHAFFTAYQDAPTWAGLVEPNLTMLRHLLDGLDAHASNLRHVSIMQGYKVYGAHLGPFRTPAREDDPAIMPPEYMTSQQQLLAARTEGKQWSWSSLRPAVVGGSATGNPLNLALAIAVYASLCKELRLPLRFPGPRAAYESIIETTDARLLADAAVWAATAAPGNHAWNIGNGDVFRWADMWPRIAAWFGLNLAPPLSMPLTEVMADKAPAWDAMRARLDMSPLPYDRVSAWPFADFVFSWTWDMFGDTSKSRHAGFHQYVNSWTMFERLFEGFVKSGVIPPVR